MSDDYKELFDHDEYLEQMSYYFSKAEEFNSIPLATHSLGVDVSLVEEAVELHKRGMFKKAKEPENG